jgi:nucleoside-diphosphate-sugar epimerase
MTASKRALISGANGFIGRWSVLPLLERGYEVHALLAARSPQRPLPAQLAGAVIHRIDLLDATAVDSLLGAVQPTRLLHFAWITTPRIYWTSAENFMWVAASLRLVRAFHAYGGTRAVLAGSCAEYDWSRVAVCREEAGPFASSTSAAATPYAICKVALQNMLTSYGATNALSIAWGRIFSPFGPHEHPARLVPSVIQNLLLNQEAPCSHGRQVRNFLHVADVGAAFAALLDSAVEGAVNIGSDERVSIAAVVDNIATQIGRTHLVRLGARLAVTTEPAILVPDVRRLYDEVGWRPEFTLAAGLADTISWWRQTLQRGAPPDKLPL